MKFRERKKTECVCLFVLVIVFITVIIISTFRGNLRTEVYYHPLSFISQKDSLRLNNIHYFNK